MMAIKTLFVLHNLHKLRNLKLKLRDINIHIRVSTEERKALILTLQIFIHVYYKQSENKAQQINQSNRLSNVAYKSAL
jgi:hypothetical protein